MKYIDAEKLKTDLESLYDNMLNRTKIDKDNSDYWAGRADAYRSIIDTIASLQQEHLDVDLKKELDQWRHKHFKGKRDGDYNGEYLERESQLDLAHHFYELGLNARK